MKITDYPQIATLLGNNVLLADGPNGTKTIKASDLAKALATLLDSDGLFEALNKLVPPEQHRMIFRGKNLGSAFTQEQRSRIQDGTFDDLWLGDYWQIGNAVYRIADFDYWFDCGDTKCNEHHLVVMPDNTMYGGSMLGTGETYYASSTMRSNGLGVIVKSMITAVFGDALFSHRECLVTGASSSGFPLNSEWFDSEIELPSEKMIFGSTFLAPMNPANNDSPMIPANQTISGKQLALFMVAPKYMIAKDISGARTTYWLRDGVTPNTFAFVDASSVVRSLSGTSGNGIRPVFGIG